MSSTQRKLRTSLLRRALGGLVSEFDVGAACLEASPHDALGALQEALDTGAIDLVGTVPENRVYRVSTASDRLDPGHVACASDPFLYLSHFSAMAHHGMTDRLPQIIYATTLDRTRWIEQANRVMKKERPDMAGALLEAGLPLLRPRALRRVGRTTIETTSSKHHGRLKDAPHLHQRVATRAQTLLDMIRRPGWCGGIYHVLDTLEAQLPKHADLAIELIDRRGRPIDKVRMGYVIEERLGIRNEVVRGWRAFVRRGGSRVLDAGSPFDGDHYSEAWALSLNI